MRDLEVELQKANNKAYNAEHQLTQLSLKVGLTLMHTHARTHVHIDVNMNVLWCGVGL